MAKKHQDTSYGGGSSRFATTEWTKILNCELGGAVLAELYTKYWRPVYSFLRRKGFSNDQAKDLIQGFFSEKILGQQLLQKADRTKGKFRTFLLTSLKNYATDLHRRERPAQELDGQPEKPSRTADPEAEFDMAWAQELLQAVLKELEAECRARDKNAHWELFRAWLLESDGSDDKPDMSGLCARYGIDDPSTAYNMVANLKDRFRKILRRHLRPHVNSDQQVDEEISHFIDIFSRCATRY